ncbi:hypothetical protein D030_0562A, partial [Vibrio parahaemolyticus AQ3810]
MFEKH